MATTKGSPNYFIYNYTTSIVLYTPCTCMYFNPICILYITYWYVCMYIGGAKKVNDYRM